MEVWPRRLDAFLNALWAWLERDEFPIGGNGELTISAMASSSSSRLSRGGLLLSLCCFRPACPFLGAEVGSDGLESPDRRALDSKLGEGTEMGCEGVKLELGADRDLPPRFDLDEAELMAISGPAGVSSVQRCRGQTSRHGWVHYLLSRMSSHKSSNVTSQPREKQPSRGKV